MEQYDHRIDEYIGKKAAFAQPILKHLRALMHSVSPQITETIKWGHPFFEYKGTLANMAAFKEHCVFGFWNSTAINDPYGVMQRPGEKEAAGNFDRITKLSDLPSDEILKDFILQGIALKDNNYKPSAKKASVPKAPIEMPDYFAAALADNQKALAIFQDFSPSCKREYLEWITEAKTDATRQKRIETALEWIGEGKTRNWKYK
ncbi:YdeI family protein [Mucilaginibacter sp. UR6-11]|uniref:YdeI/OmpD-associated family protein n=1 Tax=Mucilaginibacter sp. UR6-11 TaxID=1435644 RepID=UPI001E4A0BA6|nr:YdeI/OmpD-associated family protein [Mucilaginibacter sp. UR6-11]MCC8424091.1 YdeI/OmpD-associated family protein [Mucilaginibacter sp. UR6-11]